MSQSGALQSGSIGPDVPTTFLCDVGSAVPISNTLEVFGGGGASTSGSGNTITITTAGDELTITGDSGGALLPTVGNWNIVGGDNLTTSGAVSTLTVSLTDLTQYAVLFGASSSSIQASNLGTNGQLLIGSTGSYPAFASLTSSGGTITFTTGANSLNLEASSAVPLQFDGDSGSATPAASVINIVGSGGITTSAAGNTVTINGAGEQIIHLTALDHTDSPYTVLTSDYYFTCDVSGGVLQIELPNAPTTGSVWIVKDATGSCAAQNITVTTVGGAVNLDGAVTFVMNTAYQSAQFVFNGSYYEVF